VLRHRENENDRTNRSNNECVWSHSGGE
jgi:hypothetical protein